MTLSRRQLLARAGMLTGGFSALSAGGSQLVARALASDSALTVSRQVTYGAVVAAVASTGNNVVDSSQVTSAGARMCAWYDAQDAGAQRYVDWILDTVETLPPAARFSKLDPSRALDVLRDAIHDGFPFAGVPSNDERFSGGEVYAAEGARATRALGLGNQVRATGASSVQLSDELAHAQRAGVRAGTSQLPKLKASQVAAGQAVSLANLPFQSDQVDSHAVVVTL
jgi:hypothetical protein